VVKNTVTPDAARLVSRDHMVCRLRGSSPVVGSSRKITLLRPRAAIAIVPVMGLLLRVNPRSTYA
jgi:hypothetical protein